MGDAEFFDSIAENWDKSVQVDEKKIRYLLSKLDIKEDYNILDVGTGTGVLVQFLKDLNPKGNINCIDISKGMLEVAKKKYGDIKNVSFKLLDVENDIINEKYDSIILYSMFPHLNNKVNTIKSLVNKNLSKNGKLIIAHSNSREFLNNMHKNKDKKVSNDRLISVQAQKALFEQAELYVEEAFENEEMYYIIIKK